MLSLNLLGPVEATVKGRTMPLASEGPGIVICSLALSPGIPVSCQNLYEALWGDYPPKSCRQLLNHFIAGLRIRLNLRSDELIVQAGGGYLLAAPHEFSDLQRFHRYRRFARHLAAQGRAREAAAVYAKALALNRGAPFGGAGQGWLRAAATGVRDMIRSTEAEALRLHEEQLSGAQPC
ncbi:AfsR/SARP family transcriptional regulator [Thermoactinospora rubra]|uniref:AfsR/SARP family transcriptional regulator n=1 Tax=Thermoactinospora rubra TaxID=1088767 RepID=UPI001180FA8A|nr:BTAD domain-containing putative transcriptional regulator [Thermoactinospora rubra]